MDDKRKNGNQNITLALLEDQEVLNDEYEILVDKLTSASDGEVISIAKLSK